MPEGGHCMRKKDFDRTSELVEKNVPLTSETESCYIHMLGNANEMVRKLAFQWFLAKAEEGVSSAESVVALCYRSGIGTVRNDSRFVLWIQRAVRDGDSNAQTYLGSYLLEGIENVLPQDVTHGVQLLEQAVLQENADAMLILGRWLVEQNDSRPEQQQRGFALLQKAESAGNPDALCEVGCCLLYGVGTPANQKLGLEKLRQAAEAGISVAQEALGTFLIHTNVDKAENVRNQGVYWLTKAAEEGSISAQRELGCGYLYNGDIEVNFSEAEKWLTRAVEGGDMESCASLAFLYLEGQTARSSLKKAARVLQLGTERGDHMCMTLLACFYQDGICVPKDPEKAFAMFQEASSDEMSARFHVAECYLSGSGVEKDEAFALQWYREIRKSLPIDNILINECHVMDGISDASKKRVQQFLRRAAEETGNAKAQYALGMCLLNQGNPVPADDAEAAAWLQKAADQGHAHAQTQLGICYLDGIGIPEDPERAVELFEAASAVGEREATFQLGSCYRFGIGVDTDLEEAVRLLRIAAGESMKIPCTPNASALYALGVCYENGDGVPVDTDKALDYLKRAADMGSADAQCELGYYYFDSEENYGKALEWFQKAADLGNPNGQYMVGICHFKGDDGEEDEIAMDWFEKAADNGHDEAQYMMGFCYFNGIGTDPDEDEAAYWLRLAAAQGHEDAKQMLEDYMLGEADEDDDDDTGKPE